MIEDKPEIEHGILVRHARHEGVLSERIGPAGILLIRAMDLLIQRLDVGGEEAMEVESVTISGGESGAFVVVGCAEEIAPLY
jgi:hypothetical protein